MTAAQRLACLSCLIVAGLSFSGCGSSGGGGSTPTQPTGPAGDFSLAASPSSVSLTQGNSIPVSVSAKAVNGLTGNVSVAITGLPSGVTSSPASPFSIAVGSTMSVTLTAAKAANLGPTLLSFEGTQGKLSHSASAALNVGPFADFGIAIQPGSVSLTQGAASSPVSVVVTPLNAFSGNVAVSIAGLPAGISASTGGQFNITAGTPRTITFNAAPTVAPGTAALTLQGTSGSLSHTASAAIQIQAAVSPDFGLTVAPGLVAVTQGHQSQLAISASGINGFSGNVAVAISGLPAGVTASPATLSIAPGSSQTVTFSAPINARPGAATLTFTGVGGSITHSATATIQTLGDSVFSLTYFDTTANENEAVPPDETVTIVSPGIQSSPSSTPDLCANIYVFAADQQLQECCSCDVTANETRVLSVNRDLTSNPGNGVAFRQGTIAVVPGTLTAGGFCDATAPNVSPDLVVWGTHVAPGVAATGTIVETRASDLTLSGTELTNIAATCGF